MVEEESSKSWAVSRWLDEVEARARRISPEITTEATKAYRSAYLAAISDFKGFLSEIGMYR